MVRKSGVERHEFATRFCHKRVSGNWASSTNQGSWPKRFSGSSFSFLEVCVRAHLALMPDHSSLFVGGLPREIDEREVERIFGKAAEVKKIHMKYVRGCIFNS